MSTKMSTVATHEPINYLDSVLNEEEEGRCGYSHQWRNFTISRSGRFKSKNKKRDVVDGKLFDKNAVSAVSKSKDKEQEQDNKIFARPTPISSRSFQQTTQATVASTKGREKMEVYKSFYETNL